MYRKSAQDFDLEEVAAYLLALVLDFGVGLGPVKLAPLAQRVGSVLSLSLARMPNVSGIEHHGGPMGQAQASSGEHGRVSTLPLIEWLVTRLQRTWRRETEADAPHLLEAVGVIIYDPDTGELASDFPPVGSGLRWNQFVTVLAETYGLRFE